MLHKGLIHRVEMGIERSNYWRDDSCCFNAVSSQGAFEIRLRPRAKANIWSVECGQHLCGSRSVSGCMWKSIRDFEPRETYNVVWP